MNLGRGGGLKCSYIFIVFAQSSLAAPPFGAPVVAISLPLGLPAQLAPARTPLLRRPRGSHRSANPRNQLAHASSRSPPRRRLIWASVPPSATRGCVPSPHNAAPHGADGRRRGFSISHDAVVSVVAIGESLGYLRRPGTLRPPALFSQYRSIHPPRSQNQCQCSLPTTKRILHGDIGPTRAVCEYDAPFYTSFYISH